MIRVIRRSSDSVSLAPLLRGKAQEQAGHDYLYWEFYERGGAQAVRAGDWKAVRKPMRTGAVELYDLSRDVGEARDLAGEHPDVAERMAGLMDEAHRPHPNWK